MILPIFLLCAASFVISWVLTLTVKRVAPRVGFVDKPGGRKIHANPKPLGGGVAIFWAFALPMIGGILFARMAPSLLARGPGSADRHYEEAIAGGVQQQTPLALTLLAAVFGIHLMGLFDDCKALGPYVKLVLQLALAAVIVVPFERMHILTALDAKLGAHGALSIALSILWITAITNAFNFLDNMDGLSAGIAAVCTIAFLIATLSIGQLFVAATLAMLLGAILGFLCFNFPPATIFMGDSGSLVIGLVLGAMTIRTTYLPPNRSFVNAWYAVFAPVIVLAVPLYDLIVVSIIRISRGKSPFVGDTNHFSHRLVARGMSRRTAVLCLYLITAATSVTAIVLPEADSTFTAMLLFGQTLLILGVVALLEQHPLPPENPLLVPKDL
jgi:UDP-GlcNAc:undecaprenyl-phosphate/decaprenyl-phosphate GlcNAc-1-phosphate transferase